MKYPQPTQPTLSRPAEGDTGPAAVAYWRAWSDYHEAAALRYAWLLGAEVARPGASSDPKLTGG